MAKSGVIKKLKRFWRYGTFNAELALARKREREDQARKDRFESETWQKAEGEAELARRQYGSYDEYVEHQASKLSKIYDRRVEKDREHYEEFLRRFQGCEPLQKMHTVLCLGARLGAEVEALHELGFLGIGIDLEPGKQNARVLYGDFHNLVFPDGSYDAAYTNAFDHVFDLEKVVVEIARVLRPGGILIADVVPGFEEGFVPGNYEATCWPTIGKLIETIEGFCPLRKESVTDHGDQGRNRWHQIVFRRPEA